MHIDDLETPVAVIDLDKVEANIGRLQSYLDEHNIANWPHIKTHKIPALAHWQIKAGAAGIACQKVSEAEVMADAGIDNILIPYNIVGPAKTRRLARLAKRTNVSVAADSAYTINGLSEAATEASVTIAVLVEFDSGRERCGVQTPEEAADLARLITQLPGLHFAGLMCYPSTDQTDTFVRQTKALLADDGIVVERVSGGGTPVMWQAHNHQEVTEHRAGTYIYGDRGMVNAGALQWEDCALRVIATVVSRPTADRGILDSGSKSLSADLFGLEGHGYIVEYPQARLYGLSEEHGHVDFANCPTKPQIGERVSIIPNHCCLVTNLFNEIVAMRNNEVEVIWPVAARGHVQ